MTTKKPEPQAEYDFRSGVRGKHHVAVKKAAAEVREPPTGKPEQRVPKTVKR